MICVDASVGAKWILTEEHSDEARALLRSALESAEPVVAPPFLPTEVTNIIRQRVRRDILTHAEGEHLLTRFLAFPVSLTASSSLHLEALRVANRYDLAGAYDAHYVALAQMLTATFWTNDHRLLRALSKDLPFVRWIGNYTA